MNRSWKQAMAWTSVFLAMPAPAALPTRQVLSVSVMMKLTQVAVDRCASDGFAIAVAIMDRHGQLRMFVATPDVSPISIELSKRKARTAAMFATSSGVIGERMKANPLFLTNMMAIDPMISSAQGALPIMAGKEFVGSIGISGGPNGASDEICAQAALDAIALR